MKVLELELHGVLTTLHHLLPYGMLSEPLHPLSDILWEELLMILSQGDVPLVDPCH